MGKRTKMLRSVWLLIFCFFMSSVIADEKVAVDKMETLAPLPTHWQQSHMKEPIFGGLVHVIETGNRHKQTIILVHGLGYSGLRDWLDVIPSLESEYHIVALDLPGFGESDSTSLQLAPQRYAELLKWLIPQFSKQKVIIIGHSMGGAISLRFTSSFPEMVDKLIMVDTAGVLHRTAFVRHMTQMPDRYAFLAKYQEHFNFVDSAVNKFNRFVNRVSGSVLRKLDKMPDPTLVLMNNPLAQKYAYKDRPTLNAAIGLINEDFSTALHQFLTPTHIIWGEYDRVAPLRTGELLQYHLDNAQLHVVKNAGHVPMKDKTEDFLQKLSIALRHTPKKAKKYVTEYNGQTADLHCNKQEDIVYSGVYSSVYINNCRYVTLNKLSARNLIIENSEVTLDEVNITSDVVAMDIKNSFVTMTNVSLSGTTALRVEASTVDIAGAKLVSSNDTIEAKADSIIYLSVSEKVQNGYQQFLHGISKGNHFYLQ
ncbi:alpha/beta fold hydrolase [Paraglaciecola sp. L3A3]|uniref:alpha/beta fold hydrolase n=1 Tax=Paraglaciecola sp. L3A3 TaxID=2686358 RepID=UPI00131A6502|nr:alpha/beta hydrolase [Paraglaciecola sp. L3A3]